ncbi:MAG: hypothetical protein ACC645_24195, partial [Pirellulales bacterium]
KPVPPGDNFCAIPLLASLSDFTVAAPGAEIEYRDEEARDRFLEMQLPDPGNGIEMPKLPDLADSRGIELDAWAAYFRQAEGFDTGDATAPSGVQIRNAFTRFDAGIDEIAAAAASRPQGWFPVKLGNSFMETISAPFPHLSDLIQFSRFLTVKGGAAAAGGDAATARKCVQIQLRLAEAVGAEPLLLFHLVEISMVNQAAAVIREGLLARSWSEDDLEWLSSRLAEVDLYERSANALRGEMTGFFLAGTRFLKSANSREWRMLTGVSGNSSGIREKVAYRLLPDGWLDHSAAIGCDLLYRRGILPLKTQEFSGLADDWLDRDSKSSTPYHFLVNLLLPATESLVKRTVRTQVLLDAARVACALESYHLRNRAYPDSLEALAPEYLPSIPQDPITGGPLLFKKNENGYRIYSVGLNKKDDGGISVGRGGQTRGDWVFACDRDAS